MNFGYFSTFKSIDKGLIEKVGPTGFTLSIFNTSANFIKFYSGSLYHTIFFILSFAFLFLTFYFSCVIGFFTSFNFQFLLLIFSFLFVSLLYSTKNS